MESDYVNISVCKTKCFHYPPPQHCHCPTKIYPEYPFQQVIPYQKNQVYDAVRQTLHLLKLDETNYGTKQWNPFQELIHPGDTVLIKPNLVMDHNKAGFGNECLYTQPSVVAPVIDFALIALKGTGKIIIGDAPVQECNFDFLLKESGYKQLVGFYNSRGINNIEIVDFRGLVTTVKNGTRTTMTRENLRGKIIDLKSESEFAQLSPSTMERMRITNYNPDALQTHHTNTKNEYCVSDYLLSADVVINMPKPKTHRKAGVTLALKNFVGINAHKEYLPHHTIGSVVEGGDEYLAKNKVRALRSHWVDQRNRSFSKSNILAAKMYNLLIKGCSAILKFSIEKYAEGSWYGNCTVCRTISDLNKIVLFADKNGNMCDVKQRKIFIVADMLVSGEKEGPLFPSPKKVGIVAAGTDLVCFDEVICTLMGFDYKKIPTITNARDVHGKYLITNSQSNAKVVSNYSQYNLKTIGELRSESLLNYIPADGWLGHIEI